MAVAAPSPSTGADRSPRRTFVYGIFVLGVIITVVVGYLGVVGALGGGIAGTRSGGVGPTPPLSSCQGHGALGHFDFSIVADARGARSFNATSPGPCFAVAAGSTVSMNFSVAPGTNHTESWALIPSTGPVGQPPAFAGAGWSNSTATTGIPQGANYTFHFAATTPGSYRYVSQVPGDAELGLWGPFNVTASPLTLAPEGTSHPAASDPPGPSAIPLLPPVLRAVHVP